MNLNQGALLHAQLPSNSESARARSGRDGYEAICLIA